jgi:uncharacterized OB-fold protein
VNGDALQRLEPPISRTAEPFWDATREKRLLLQHCPSCDRAIWFPRALCPRCANADLQWRESDGRGVVHAVSVQYQAANPQMRDRVPYAVALVDLTEGVRLMSNVVGCDPESVTVAMAVVAAWEPLSDGRHLLVFEPAQERRP